MRNVEAQFSAAIQAAGLVPPKVIHADGKLHRFSSSGKPGDTAGYYVLFPGDIPAGMFGCFRKGIKENWGADIGPSLTPAEVVAHKIKMEAMRRQHEAKELANNARKAEIARRLWGEAMPLQDHPYLERKGIKTYGAAKVQQAERLKGDEGNSLTALSGLCLLLPIQRDSQIVALQAIQPDGERRFIGSPKGGALALGQIKDAPRILIAEGFATAASLHEATGHPSVCAFSASNLLDVAQRLRKAHPGADLVLCADRDAHGMGEQKAIEAALAVGGHVVLPDFSQVPDSDKKAKASDFNDLHQLAGLEEVARQVAEAMTQAASNSTKSNPLPTVVDEEAYINNLAALKELDYMRQRKAAAEALGGIPLAGLDKLVAAARKERKAGTEGAGAGILFPNIEPWAEPVSGAEILDEVYAILSRYVIADKVTLYAATLWIALTWFVEGATVLPLALITAPEKGCGKSTLLSVLAKLAKRALPASNVSPAAMFRALEKWRPTLIVDEADTFMRDNPELVGILNSGHTRDSAFVVRTVGDDHEPKSFSTWGAKAISGIGAHGLADTITSRSIVLMMRRKLPGERCDNLRHASSDAFHATKRKLARWAEDHMESFADLHPILDGLSNRTADNWEPLLALADLAGGVWPKLSRQTALTLSGQEEDAPSLNQELLGDIRAVFDRLMTDRLFTATLLTELCQDEESAWATYNRGKPVTPRQLSKRLDAFGIKPDDIRIGHDVRKGYKFDQFKDAFSRYLAEGGNLSATTLHPNNGAGYGVADADIDRLNETVSATRKPSIDAGCSVVADKPTLEPGEVNNGEDNDGLNNWLSNYESEQEAEDETEYF